MADTEEEGMDGRSSTDGRAACKSRHYWSQGVVLSFGDESVDKIEISQVPQEQSVSVARQTNASCINQEWSQLVGIFLHRQVRGEDKVLACQKRQTCANCVKKKWYAGEGRKQLVQGAPAGE